MNKYLNSCRSEFWKKVFKKEMEYILKELEGCKDILSVGCGPAVIEKGLKEYGFNFTGLDVSKEAISNTPDNVKTVLGSAEDMGFDSATFEAAVYIASLQFVDNYKKALDETSRVLETKGKLLAMLLNPKSEFFKSKRRETNSYVNKIKNPDLDHMERAIKKRFDINKKEYYLGIKDKEMFKSQDTDSAALYIIRGTKR